MCVKSARFKEHRPTSCTVCSSTTLPRRIFAHFLLASCVECLRVGDSASFYAEIQNIVVEESPRKSMKRPLSKGAYWNLDKPAMEIDTVSLKILQRIFKRTQMDRGRLTREEDL